MVRKFVFPQLRRRNERCTLGLPTKAAPIYDNMAQSSTLGDYDMYQSRRRFWADKNARWFGLAVVGLLLLAAYFGR